MSVYQAYGNRREMILFKVTISRRMVEDLVLLGFLEEDAFDVDAYFNESDANYSQEMAQPVLDAIIDYFSDRAEATLEVESDKMDNGKPYDESFMDLSSDLERIYDVVSCGHDFMDTHYVESLVSAVWVDPENPYKGYIGGF